MTTNDGQLEGRVAIVTGASSGIGAGVAVAMAEAGAKLAIVGRSTERLEETHARIAAVGEEPCVIAADLCADDAPGRVVAQTLDRFGSINVLFNGAGVFELAPFEDSLELLDRQWQVNVRAPFALTIAALPHLRPGGAVIFMSSGAGHSGFATGTAYCATKGAIELLTKALAIEEAGNGVRVNAIAPGNIRTPMNEGLLADPEYERSQIEATPLRRIGEVDDIAPLAVMLASDASSYVTGHSMVVDGGWNAQ
jgi:NAD(P)-dependent dehydrogenase (short-subunit alcohol dehydrogenase family)